MMRWWWFGAAVTKAQLEREMRTMKEGGIGGFEVQQVYPLAPDDETGGIRNAPFLSQTFKTSRTVSCGWTGMRSSPAKCGSSLPAARARR
jgi:hypothetical protein